MLKKETARNYQTDKKLQLLCFTATAAKKKVKSENTVL